jgi:hypothetical protein
MKLGPVAPTPDLPLFLSPPRALLISACNSAASASPNSFLAGVLPLVSRVPWYEALARYGRRGRLNATAYGAMISALTTRHKATQVDAFAYDTTPSVVPFTWGARSR